MTVEQKILLTILQQWTIQFYGPVLLPCFNVFILSVFRFDSIFDSIFGFLRRFILGKTL